MTQHRKRVLRPEVQERQVAQFKERWFPRSVGFTDEQGAVLRHITDEYRLSLSEVIDACFARYFPRHFGMRWPPAQRQKRRWRLHQYKVKRHDQNVRIYGMLFNAEQDAVLNTVLDRLGRQTPGTFSAIVEDALLEWTPRLFSVTWPRANRRRILSHRRVDSA